MKLIFTLLPMPLTAALFFIVGACVGNRLMRWIVRLEPFDRLSAAHDGTRSDGPTSTRYAHVPIFGYVLSREGATYRGERIGGWSLFLELGTGLLFACFVIAMVEFRCQQTEMVRPSDFWRYGRIVYHLVLMSLLIAAAGTDFRNYVIPDQITFTGIAVGVLGAVVSADLQMMHLWLDWNAEIPGLKHPYFPLWIDEHRHLHGLAWSLAGMGAGAGITWSVRAVSSWLLGQPALGFGDVTLMAMVGSFIGWQPVLLTLLLAPLCAVIIGLTVRLSTGRRFVPFGPYLAAATVVVLFSWRWLWNLQIPWAPSGAVSVRRLFGDWPSLAILGGTAFAALVLLLGLIRLYRSVPVDRRSLPTDTSAVADEKRRDERGR